MNKKILSLLLLPQLLFSCTKELTLYLDNEFNTIPSFCTQSDILEFYKNKENYTLSLVKIESIDNNTYMQSYTTYCSDNEIDPNTGYLSLKGYDNQIRILMIKCKIIKDYYVKGTNDLTINIPFYLNYSSNSYYKKEDIITFFNSFDKMLFYFNINKIEERTYFENNISQKEVNFSNCYKDTLLHYNYFMPVTNDKLDISKYNSQIIFDNVYGNYTDYLNDGSNLEELEEGIKKIEENADKAVPEYCF